VNNWLSRSFFRQVSVLLLVFSVASITAYAIHNFYELRRQWRDTIQSQSSSVTDLMALATADDLRYGKLFDLWSKLMRFQKQQDQQGALYRFREVTVLDNDGNTIGSTDPIKHPLMQSYGHPPGTNASWEDSIGTTDPIEFGGEKIGSMVVLLDITPFKDFLWIHLRDFAIYLFIVTLASVALGLALARWITRPLSDIQDALPLMGSGAIALGSLTRRHDEYGRLARAIESADKRILKDAKQIRMHNDTLEETVKLRTVELTASNKELEAFSYSVSHDLRAPLRAIDGFSQALLEDYGDKLDETASAYLKRVRAGAQKMGSLIDDLLQLSRVTRLEMKYARIDLSTLAERIMQGLRADAPERDAEIHIAPDLSATGDAGLLQIMLQNLLGNAWKYTGKMDRALIEFGSLAKDGEQVYFIRDNGAGFDMRYVAKLFGAFQRLHTEDEFPGTGIGLATVQRIVNRHGGRIWAEGEVGKGSCFYFVLPHVADQI
jgi:signal transduction histidine kinase